MKDMRIREMKEYWERYAQYDPLWAILSDPSKMARRWNLKAFFETGLSEVSVLFYRLQNLGISFARGQALDFGCGIGRLTLPLAEHFDRVTGIDISETMIELADRLNTYPEKVRYVCNPSGRLRKRAGRKFDFIYTNIVLQHIQPKQTLKYLSEFRRVLKPEGLLVFQLPSHPRPEKPVGLYIKPMDRAAYAARLRLLDISDSPFRPSADLVLNVQVKNASPVDWIQDPEALIKAGNHWLTADGSTMLIRDDGRAALPPVLPADGECLVSLPVHTPPQEGVYRCEIDLVHEAVSWFKDLGSPTIHCDLRVLPEQAPPSAPSVRAESDTPTFRQPDPGILEKAYWEMPMDDRAPDHFPMYGISREKVVAFFESRGDSVIRIEDDADAGTNWVSYRYIVRRGAKRRRILPGLRR